MPGQLRPVRADDFVTPEVCAERRSAIWTDLAHISLHEGYVLEANFSLSLSSSCTSHARKPNLFSPHKESKKRSERKKNEGQKDGKAEMRAYPQPLVEEQKRGKTETYIHTPITPTGCARPHWGSRGHQRRRRRGVVGTGCRVGGNPGGCGFSRAKTRYFREREREDPQGQGRAPDVESRPEAD